MTLQKLDKLWRNLSEEEQKLNFYGVSHKFYEIYTTKVNKDVQLLEEHFNVAAETVTGNPNDAVINKSTNTIYFTARVTLPLEPDIAARVFLKYHLDGKEFWWSNIRGPRGKLFDRLFREYFSENTDKEAR